tara:strand:+ start:399 stop:1274 length:876 start_codon:yes stop_codon:yes gene_type:complete
MRIGIIGSSGFIGSHYVARLRRDGHVILSGDIVDGDIDIRDQQSVTNWFNVNKPEIVILTAAIIRQNDIYMDPWEGLNTNVNGLVNVLSCCKDSDTTLMFSSTVHVYEGLTGTVDENTPLDSNKPKHLYTQTKITGEEIIRSYNKLYGLKYVIFRYGVLYGFNGHSDMVVNTFVTRAVENMPLKITGDGHQSRCFINIEDLCDAVSRVISTGVLNTTINICESINYTILDIVTLIKSHIPTTRIEYIQPRASDLSSPVVLNHRACSMVKWSTTSSLETYIKMYVEKSIFEA